MRLELVRVSDGPLREISTEAMMCSGSFRLRRRPHHGFWARVKLRRALALARGGIAEMQTGEGKTPAAVGWWHRWVENDRASAS